MAKIKTFADGELLTATDVNDVLNPDVPPGASERYALAAVQLEANIAPAAGGIRVERDGLFCMLFGDIVTTPTNFLGPGSTRIGTIPPGFVPVGTVVGGGGRRWNAVDGVVVVVRNDDYLGLLGAPSSSPANSRWRFNIAYMAER